MEGLRDVGECDGGGSDERGSESSSLTQGGAGRLAGNPARGLRYRKLEAMEPSTDHGGGASGGEPSGTSAGAAGVLQQHAVTSDDNNHDFLLVRGA